jgi:hypothetical protein
LVADVFLPGRNLLLPLAGAANATQHGFGPSLMVFLLPCAVPLVQGTAVTPRLLIEAQARERRAGRDAGLVEVVSTTPPSALRSAAGNVNPTWGPHRTPAWARVVDDNVRREREERKRALEANRKERTTKENEQLTLTALILGSFFETESPSWLQIPTARTV